MLVSCRSHAFSENKSRLIIALLFLKKNIIQYVNHEFSKRLPMRVENAFFELYSLVIMQQLNV